MTDATTFASFAARSASSCALYFRICSASSAAAAASIPAASFCCFLKSSQLTLSVVNAAIRAACLCFPDHNLVALTGTQLPQSGSGKQLSATWVIGSPRRGMKRSIDSAIPSFCSACFVSCSSVPSTLLRFVRSVLAHDEASWPLCNSPGQLQERTVNRTVKAPAGKGARWREGCEIREDKAKQQACYDYALRPHSIQSLDSCQNSFLSGAA